MQLRLFVISLHLSATTASCPLTCTFETTGFPILDMATLAIYHGLGQTDHPWKHICCNCAQLNAMQYNTLSLQGATKPSSPLNLTASKPSYGVILRRQTPSGYSFVGKQSLPYRSDLSRSVSCKPKFHQYCHTQICTWCSSSG